MRDLREQAMRDPLTNLPNRRAVLARLEELQAQADGQQHAFFMLDLNEFKRVNDQHGHGAGDSVLQVVAERFKRVARPTDLLARLGGDEFAVLSYDIDRAGAAAVGNRFLGALQNQVWVEGTGHDVGVSIGAVLVPQGWRHHPGNPRQRRHRHVPGQGRGPLGARFLRQRRGFAAAVSALCRLARPLLVQVSVEPPIDFERRTP